MIMLPLLLKLKRKINSAFYVTLRLFNYYPFFTHLHGRGEKTSLTEEYELEFTEEEKAFLKICAASYNYCESDFALGHRQKELSIYKLKNVTFFSNTGAIMLDHKLIVESALSVDRLTQTKAFRDFSVLLPLSFRVGNYTTIQHSHWADNNVYHWFIDCFPRLYIITNAIKEPTTVLMWDGIPDYQKHLVGFILNDNPYLKVKYLKKNLKIKIADFYLPSFVTASFSGYLPPRINCWVRENIWNAIGLPRSNAKQRIYISRSKAKSRKILNEKNLLLILERFGFKAVWLEDLDFKQIVELFYTAEAVVSPHGAGLTNILFAQQCSVLELHPANIIKPLYMLLSKGLNFNYTPIIGSDGDNNENFKVPLDKVEGWLLNRYTPSP